MVNKGLNAPLLLPTVGFVVGCVIFRGEDLWVPLTLFGVCGALFIWRGWSAMLLAMVILVGGVRVTIDDKVSDPTITTSVNGEEKVDDIFSKTNAWAQSQIEKLQLSSRAKNLTSAMILGNRDEIKREQRRNYGVSGASHILAVSGLHISIMVVFFNLLFRPVVLLPRGHIILNIVMIIAIWGYACVVGLSESVLRSAAMFMVLQIAWALGELYSGINGLCVAVLGCVIVSPTILYSVGFQLSVIAVASIFLWGLPLYYRFFGGGGALISALCISACCCVATMPIVSYIFGYVPILGVVFSPLYILCMAVIIAVGMTWIIFPLGIFDAPLRLIIESVALILEGSVDWVASKSWGFVEWQMSLTQLILIYLIYIVITLLVWWNKNEKKRKKSNINL